MDNKKNKEKLGTKGTILTYIYRGEQHKSLARYALKHASRNWEDLVQESILKALEQNKELQKDAGYVMTVAKNILINTVKMAKDNESELSVEAIQLSDMIYDDLVEKISKLITPVQLTILKKREDGYTYREIADKLHMSKSSVHRLHISAQNVIISNLMPSDDSVKESGEIT